jgi:adenine-specific DNA methylase
MIPRECKRLAEVDFPIATVSRHAAREKSVRHGHPSTLHLWWARRPLASSRAMLLALLLPDPADPQCPAAFKTQARAALQDLPNMGGARGTDDLKLREAVLRFIGDCADWDRSADMAYLTAARALIRAAHGEETPLVVDPFAGGGSIPLEALRLGCDVYASDLNPVACLILKTMLEDVPRHGPGLAEKVRAAGAEIKAAAERELGRFYPLDPDGARPIAYLWARTVRCEASECGAEIPLARSFWLATKKSRQRALRYHVERPKDGRPHLRFEVFEPVDESEVPRGTVSRATAICACCSKPLAPDRVRAQLRAQRGGADVVFDSQGRRIGGATMLAIVTQSATEIGRLYRAATTSDYAAVYDAQRAVGRLPEELTTGVTPVPNEPTPKGGGSGAGRAFSIYNYGMTEWGNLFIARQRLALAALSRIVSEFESKEQYVKEILGLAVSRWADISNALCRWESTKNQVRNLFTRQAISVVWDFAEAGVFGAQAGDFSVTLESMLRTIERLSPISMSGQVGQADACKSKLPSEVAHVWFTDPPYYDAIPYSDLSDFFFVWLKRALPTSTLLRDVVESDNSLTPKIAEIVQDETKMFGARPKDSAFFEEAMGRAFGEGRRVINDDGIGCVVFAHKTTEGWEALLSGLIEGGWTITGSWPVATESGTRLRAKDSAALATSVHLVCRPREGRSIGDWGEVLRELPGRVAVWMERLQAEDVRGADLVFACIGPALEIFSRYEHVETPDGTRIPLADYLGKVWEVVGRAALEQILGTEEARARNGLAGVLEEDARLTALFLWTLQSDFKDARAAATDDENEADGDAPDDEDDSSPRSPRGFTLMYDVVRRFAQPLGIHLDTWTDRIIETRKGTVRLLPVAERAHQLFGADDVSAIATAIERDRKRAAQLDLFPEPEPPPRLRIGGRAKGRPAKAYAGQATTLDRVHAAMLLQRGGQANALRALLQAEAERGRDFARLANALSALYPKDTEEKRLLDAMLLAMPR